MKTLSLTPYPGHILLFDSMKELRKRYEKITRIKYPYRDRGIQSGMYIYIEYEDGGIGFLVYGKKASTLAHEFVHCLLKLFEIVGIDPSASKGEPLCYMLSRLMRQALGEEAANE